MTENIFTVLGFLITFSRSTADNYKQGLFLYEDYDFSPSELVIDQYRTPTSSNGNNNNQPNSSVRTRTCVAWFSVSFYSFQESYNDRGQQMASCDNNYMELCFIFVR
jgi:hypothetical protein